MTTPGSGGRRVADNSFGVSRDPLLRDAGYKRLAEYAANRTLPFLRTPSNALMTFPAVYPIGAPPVPPRPEKLIFAPMELGEAHDRVGFAAERFEDRVQLGYLQ